MHTSKATVSTVIATGNLRQGRLMADHGGLYSTTKLLLIEAKGGCVGMRARCFSYCKGGKRRGTVVGRYGMLVSCPRLPCEGESRPLRSCALIILP